MILTLVIAFAAAVLLLLPWALRRSSRQDRRDWPARVLRDYELERVRDHFFHALTVADVEWLISEGWSPPEDVACRRVRELEFLASSRMRPEERASRDRLRAAGFHVTAHPHDLRFPA